MTIDERIELLEDRLKKDEAVINHNAMLARQHNLEIKAALSHLVQGIELLQKELRLLQSRNSSYFGGPFGAF